MRIVSWNIQYGGGRRVAGLTQRFAALEPDISVLVEYRAVPPSRAVRQALAERRPGSAGAQHELWRETFAKLKVSLHSPLVNAFCS